MTYAGNLMWTLVLLVRGAQNHQASVVFVFYLGNSVALTHSVLFLVFPSSSVALAVIYSIWSNPSFVNLFFSLFLIKLGVDNSLEWLYTVHS